MVPALYVSYQIFHSGGKYQYPLPEQTFPNLSSLAHTSFLSGAVHHWYLLFTFSGFSLTGL